MKIFDNRIINAILQNKDNRIVFLVDNLDNNKKEVIKFEANPFINFNNRVNYWLINEINIINSLNDVSGIVKIIKSNIFEYKYAYLGLGVYYISEYYPPTLTWEKLNILNGLIIWKKLVKICLIMEDRFIIHKDLKAKNVIITKIENELNPIIIDFGVAKKISNRKECWNMFCHYDLYNLLKLLILVKTGYKIVELKIDKVKNLNLDIGTYGFIKKYLNNNLLVSKTELLVFLNLI